MTDLSSRLDEMVAAAERQGLLVFPGYVSEDLPAVWWQGDPDAWPDFLGIAKAEGMRTLFVGRAVLEAEDLQDLAEWVEEKEGPGHSNGDRARLKTLNSSISCRRSRKRKRWKTDPQITPITWCRLRAAAKNRIDFIRRLRRLRRFHGEPRIPFRKTRAPKVVAQSIPRPPTS
ncbi:MAG: hypothetical protein H6Q86_1059 [candidate division NC10 bacterium]|nr:hypothetical protein [candidate division NC10 bacterium]